MPATSTKQKNLMLMARAVKHGHKSLSEMPARARESIKSAMQMSDKQLKDYSHLARKKKKR